jgi:NAD(P)-dependent dehydrogenase (short-subunit alcohol dehydrogenase family)
MPTIAIVGAGPGMGLSIAKAFGHHDFQVGLISRNAEKLDGLVDELKRGGVEAARFPADVTDAQAIARAFADMKAQFGPIEVLEFSPGATGPGFGPAGALELTVESVQAQINYQVYGAMAATNQVLPDMLASGNGTLIYSTGGSSVNPRPWIANIGMAAAALRNWALCLRIALADKGIYVAHVPIGVFIGDTPETEADVIAQTYWDLHVHRDAANRDHVWWDRDHGVEGDLDQQALRTFRTANE